MAMSGGKPAMLMCYLHLGSGVEHGLTHLLIHCQGVAGNLAHGHYPSTCPNAACPGWGATGLKSTSHPSVAEVRRNGWRRRGSSKSPSYSIAYRFCGWPGGDQAAGGTEALATTACTTQLHPDGCPSTSTKNGENL